MELTFLKSLSDLVKISLNALPGIFFFFYVYTCKKVTVFSCSHADLLTFMESSTSGKAPWFYGGLIL